MITFHEIRRIIQKMALLSSHITQLNELLPQVVLLSERIDSLNEDLTLDRDRMMAKIRSVEVLGEILRAHVYQNQALSGTENSGSGFGAVTRSTIKDDPTTAGPIKDSSEPGTTSGRVSQSDLHMHPDASSLTL